MAGAFLWDDKIAGAVALTAPVVDAVSTLPLSNLIDPQPRIRTRFSADAVAVLADLGSDTAIDTVALISTTLSTAATIRRRIWTDDSTRANRIRNPAFAGAVDGSPGTLPDNMTTSLAGLTQTLATGTDSAGWPYLEWGLAGTTSSTFATLNFDTTTGIAAAVGQALVLSAQIQLVAGATTNITDAQLIGQNYSSAPAFLGTDLVASFTPSATAATIAAAASIAAVGTATLLPYLKLFFASGVAINITLRIGPPRLELGTAATLPMYPTDEMPAGAYALLADSGTLPAETSDAAAGNVVCLDATATAGRYLRVDVADSGVTQIDLGRLVAGQAWRPTHAHQYGIAEGRLMLDRRDRNGFTGAEFATPAIVNPRTARFTLPLLTTAEVIGQHRSMLASLGAAGEALWIPDTGLSQAELNSRSLWAAIATPGDAAAPSRDSHPYSSRSFTLTERV